MEAEKDSSNSDWSPTSWRQYPIKQQPEYKNADELEKSLQKLRDLPPLTHPNEIQQLKTELAAVCRGEKFLLQVRSLSHFSFDFSTSLLFPTLSGR
jgi:3-deoxy-D-arabino-heptulosonate 7-phosphate (DAHP) synthase class II